MVLNTYRDGYQRVTISLLAALLCVHPFKLDVHIYPQILII